MDQNSKKPIFFYILIRSWKSFEYFDRCIDSVLNQNYKNFKILFVDDASDYSTEQKNYIKKRLQGNVIVFNKKRRYSLFNGYSLIRRYAGDDEAVVLNLDGDDWLLGSGALSHLAKTYKTDGDCLFTYGECLLWDGSLSDKTARYILPDVNRPYPRNVINKKTYRKEPFFPLHPLTWKVWLFKKIAKRDFLDPKGRWLRFAQDQAIFFPMLEMAHRNVRLIKKPLYVYNIATPHRDVEVNTVGLLRDELTIRRKTIYKSI